MQRRRLCKKCNEKLPYTKEFFRRVGFICTDCERESARKNIFKATRGISHEDRDKLLEEQGNVCKCCGADSPNSKKGWHVDHCHRSGEIRGILCANCNIALGMVDDSVGSLYALIDYLLEHGKERATTIPKGSTLKRVEAPSNQNG